MLSAYIQVLLPGSSQSRADLLTLGLAVTNVLTGLVWLSIRPKSISVVNPQGVTCQRIHYDLPDYVVSELLWIWESLSVATCCRSLIIVYQDNCVLQIGVAAESSINSGDPIIVDTTKLVQGSLYESVMKSGSQSYLANLSLYPARSELPFLPSNTQVVLDPISSQIVYCCHEALFEGDLSSLGSTIFYYKQMDIQLPLYGYMKKMKL
uniref:Uncharacterized protein n=1 Tax=Nelumbo nucifera TaxID=4432 RepID=A0A822YAH3_NELNU|nr:TPA_asm: hypothetical protein HUJ06_009945 [Nelumbo nucifera]